MEKIFDSIGRLIDSGWTEDQAKALISEIQRAQAKTSNEQTQEANHKFIQDSSNKKILRKQLELLAEYSRIPEGAEQIPECSREMVQLYRELVKTECRSVLLPVGLFGISLSVLYGLGVSLVKFANRK